MSDQAEEKKSVTEAPPKGSEGEDAFEAPVMANVVIDPESERCVAC